MAQKDTNPYVFSDSNKRYMTYDWYLKHRFGGKAAKVSLDIGTTCPNIDGKRGCGGCIYCLGGSSSAVGDTIGEQYARGRAIMERKWKIMGFIPHLQSNTNTYGDIGRLRAAYNEAAELEGALMLDIATRADCLSGEVLSLLAETAAKIPLTVELGLQTTNDRTAEKINRCHTYAEFIDGYGRLKALAEEVNRAFPAEDFTKKRFTLGVHLINGLPGEGEEEMLQSARDVAQLGPDIVKLHLMHVLRGTVLGEMFLRGEYRELEREEYVKIVCDQLEYLPPESAIGRITGDGVEEYLLAPMWSRRKTEVVNEIDKELYRRSSFQGMRYKK